MVDDQSTESSGLRNFNEQVWSVLTERGHRDAGSVLNNSDKHPECRRTVPTGLVPDQREPVGAFDEGDHCRDVFAPMRRSPSQ